MGKLNTIRVPVDSEYVFGRGAMVVGIEAATDFDLRGKVEDAQARDKDTGQRVWLVTVIDMDQMYQPEAERSRFRRSVEMKVRVMSPQRPVPPPAQVPGFGPVVEFEGMTLTPYTDTNKCTGARDGRPHRCGARQAYSIRATGIRAVLRSGVNPGLTARPARGGLHPPRHEPRLRAATTNNSSRGVGL